MKIITRNSIFSVLKVGFITSLLATLMLLGVDLFSNLDTYTTYGVEGLTVLKLTALYIPEAFLLAMGPSFLFATTYYLSMLHANNEIICILNSGVSYRKVLFPCLCLAVFLSGFYFAFNECLALNTSNLKTSQMQIITNSENGAKDNSEIALSDMQSHYMVYANQYVDSRQTLYNVTILEKNEDSSLKQRTNAYKAVWSEEEQKWMLYDIVTYIPSEDGTSTEIKKEQSGFSETIKLEPELFRNLSSEVSRMSLSLATTYVLRMKDLNPTQYASLGTEFYKRLLSCLTPLVMIVIACSMNYRFKKNVLFFSILCSLCTAVVYYVIQMITLMLADQGVIKPYWGMLIPFIAIIVITQLVFSMLKKE